MSEDKVEQEQPDEASVQTEEVAADPVFDNPVKTSPSFVPILVAGALGAALVLAIDFGLAASGLISNEAGPSDNQTIRALSSAQADFDAELDQLRSEMAGLEGPAGSSEEVQRLTRAFQALQARVSELESAAATPNGVSREELAAVSSQVTAFNRQLTELSARIASVEASVPDDLRGALEARAMSSDLNSLRAQVAGLEARMARNDPRRAALALGLAQLTRAAAGSEPFDRELEALSSLLPGNRMIDGLGAFADQGVPTEAMLTARFARVARTTVRQSVQSDASGNWWDQAWGWLTQSITFRRRGELSGDSVPAAIARAELRIAEGNFAAALVELEAVPEASGEDLTDWREQASARVQVQRLIDGLSSDIIRDLER